MFHAALNALATPLLFLGGQVVLMERFRAEEYLELTRRFRPTILFLVPTMFQMLTEAEGWEGLDLGFVRFAISGGAPCRPRCGRPSAARGCASSRATASRSAG
jgi:fatty-acyl-CoA synthase